MKKRMFNDKAGLTKAVLEKRKTMTRSEVPEGTLLKYGINKRTFELKKNDLIRDATYIRYETAAVARAYRDVLAHIQLNEPDFEGYSNSEVEAALQQKAGWNNKMYVKAEWMPDHIVMQRIDVERLQDISEKDCIKEGVIRLPDGTFSDGFTKIIYPDARMAFKNIAETAMCAGIWERNPYVYVYEFKLFQNTTIIPYDEQPETRNSTGINRHAESNIRDYSAIKGTDEALECYACDNALELVTVTRGRNGYPEGLHHAIIGFETFGLAEEAAEAVGGRCVYLHRRDGHQFWTGENTAYSALKSEDYRDEDETIVHASLESFNDREWLKSEIEALIDADTDLQSLKEMITNLCETEEKIREMEDGKVAIMSSNTYECEIVDEYVMRIHDDDVTTYAIGVKI